MALHVLITRDGQGRAMAFNVTQEWVRERIVDPWERGEELVLDGQHWDPRRSRTAIYETGQEVKGHGFETWRDKVLEEGTDRTNDLLQRPAGPGPVAAALPEYAEDRRKVMVVHGRNGAARRSMFEFLSSIDLHPLEWTELVGGANAGAPYIGDVLDDAFAQAQAVVVLATPDDVAYLRAELLPEGDPDDEGVPRGQARPNVFLEAGMALGRFPTRTILAELGDLRGASDLGGRHAVRMYNGPECRKDLAQRLEKAGCLVNTGGTDWLTAGDFTPPPPVSKDAAAREPVTAADPLVERANALREDLKGRKGYVEWGLATVYNELVFEAGLSGVPTATDQQSTRAGYITGTPRRATMTTEEMYTHLGQLIARLGAGVTPSGGE